MKKRKLIMTSVFVFALFAIIVSTLNIDQLSIASVSQKNDKITETMNNSSQQTNENEDISSDESASFNQSEDNNISNETSSSQTNISAAQKSVNNSVSSQSPSKEQTASKSTSSAVQTKPSTSSATKRSTSSSSSYKKPSASSSYTKPSPSSSTSKPSTSGSFADYQQKVLELVNQERAAAGLKPLTMNTKLSEVAAMKSQDMANLGYFDHTSPTYGSPFDMMKQFGISYKAAGENIAKGQTSPEQVMDGWMNSPGHRANILNANFTQLGVGIAKNANGQLIWTQMFIG